MKKICIALIIVTALSIGAINTIGWIEKKIVFNAEEILSSISENKAGLQGEDVYITPKELTENKNMSVYITISRIKENGNDTFGITATARWYTKPVIRNEDIFAIGWSDDFALVDTSITACYENVGIIENKTSMINAVSNRGIGYAVSCSDFYIHSLKWVRIYAKISQIDREGMAKLIASYYHSGLNIFGVSDTTYSIKEFFY